MFFNIAFFVVIVSLLIQGWTVAPAARWFGMALKRPAPATHRIEIDLPGQKDKELVGYPIRQDSYAALRPTSMPTWLKPVLVVRDGVVKNSAEAGTLKLGDYAYFLVSEDKVSRLDRLFAPLRADALIAAKRTFFGEFAVAPDAPIGDVAAFYELEVPPAYTGLSVAEAFHVRHGDKLRPGNRLTLGSFVEFVARTVEDGRLVKASLRIDDIVETNLQAKDDTPSLSPLSRFRSLLAGR
jgi:potassium/hydrogen antiporter